MGHVLVESGFSSSGSKLTYVTLNKVASVLDTFDTCANRIEEHFYKIEIYSDNYSKLLDLIDDIEDILDQGTLTVTRRRILSIHFEAKEIEEVSPGLYNCKLFYTIIAQKDYSPTKYYHDNQDEPFYKKLIRLLPQDLNVVQTRFGQDNWVRPFLTVPRFASFDDWRTTCSRVETYNFGIVCEAYNALEVEDILEDVDNVLSFSSISWKNRRFTSLQWQGATLEEIEPEIWRGQINFELMVEKDLV